MTFAGPRPRSPRSPACVREPAGPNALRFEVSGPLAPLLARARRSSRSRSLTSREPSLEEIFLHHYDGSEGNVAV